MAERKLDKALLAAQQSLEKIGRDGFNAHGRYKYTSAEHMIGVVRKVLHENGILFSGTGVEVVDVAGNMIARCSYTLRFPDTGEERDYSSDSGIVVRGQTPLDKAIAVGQTTALNYALRELMLLPRTGEDIDQYEDKPQPKKQQQPSGPIKAEVFQSLCRFVGENNGQPFAKQSPEVIAKIQAVLTKWNDGEEVDVKKAIAGWNPSQCQSILDKIQEEAA